MAVIPVRIPADLLSRHIVQSWITLSRHHETYSARASRSSRATSGDHCGGTGVARGAEQPRLSLRQPACRRIQARRLVVTALACVTVVAVLEMGGHRSCQAIGVSLQSHSRAVLIASSAVGARGMGGWNKVLFRSLRSQRSLAATSSTYPRTLGVFPAFTCAFFAFTPF
jgi:hypothetical protein